MISDLDEAIKQLLIKKGDIDAAEIDINFEYEAALNGFAAEMSAKEAAQLAKLPEVLQVVEERIQYRKDFYEGNAPYKVATVVEHQDINTDELAQAVADRIFARSAEQKKTLRVDLTSPLPFKSLTMAVFIPDLTVTARKGGSTEQMISTYGTYMLVDYEETGSISQSGDISIAVSAGLRNVL